MEGQSAEQPELRVGVETPTYCENGNNAEVLANGHVIASEHAAMEENCGAKKVRVAIPSFQDYGDSDDHNLIETNSFPLREGWDGCYPVGILSCEVKRVPARKGKVPVHKG